MHASKRAGKCISQSCTASPPSTILYELVKNKYRIEELDKDKKERNKKDSEHKKVNKSNVRIKLLWLTRVGSEIINTPMDGTQVELK